MKSRNIPKLIGHLNNVRTKVRNLLKRAIPIPHGLNDHLRHLHGVHCVEMTLRRKNIDACTKQVKNLVNNNLLILSKINRQLHAREVRLEQNKGLEVRRVV